MYVCSVCVCMCVCVPFLIFTFISSSSRISHLCFNIHPQRHLITLYLDVLYLHLPLINTQAVDVYKAQLSARAPKVLIENLVIHPMKVWKSLFSFFLLSSFSFFISSFMSLCFHFPSLFSILCLILLSLSFLFYFSLSPFFLLPLFSRTPHSITFDCNIPLFAPTD